MQSCKNMSMVGNVIPHPRSTEEGRGKKMGKLEEENQWRNCIGIKISQGRLVLFLNSFQAKIN